MTIYYIGGQKGGTGKSVTAAVLADFLLASGRKVAIIEGDMGQPDIALRYEGRVDLRAVNLNQSGASEKAVIKFAEALDSLPPDTDIVVNLPSAAEDTIDPLAALLVDAGDSLEHEARVFYSIGHQATATQSALKSLRSGLLGAAKRRCIVYPAFLQPDVSRFDFVKSGARDEYLQSGGLETVMPAMRPEDLADKVLSLPGALSDLAKSGSALSFGERLFFGRQWLPEAHKAVAVLVDAGNDEEVTHA